MAFQWHLTATLTRLAVSWEELGARLGFPVPRDLRGLEPPLDLSLSVLADLCQALGCQPGELLTFSPDEPREQVDRHLANNALFQSFLVHQEQAKKPKR